MLTTIPQVKGERGKRVRDVIYPLIKECELYVSDPFWKQLFNDMSRGKCPKGVIIFNNTVSSTYKRNGFSYCFTDKEPQIITEELINILKTTGCIYSEKDLKEENVETSSVIYKNWKQIKCKKTKNMLIYNWVIKMSKKYNLNIYQSNNFYKLIISCLNDIKTHNSDDIILDDEGEIKEILDIKYCSKNKYFINVRDFLDIIDEKKATDYIKKSWERYIIKLYRDNKKNR
jgi:hypothetical protein